MNPIRKAAARRLAASAYEMGMEQMSGVVQQDEAGDWFVGNQSLEAWLSDQQGNEAVLILASLIDDRPVQPRTCRTCGRDYMEVECPTCRANRIRLRGRA